MLKRLKPIIFPTRIIQVDKNLYRGNAIFSPVKALRIKGKGIKQVIDLRKEYSFFANPFKALEKLYCRLLNIKYYNLNFPMTDTKKIPEMDFFKKIFELTENGEPTYIHCHFGLHRTGITIAMLEKMKKVPKDNILKRLMENSWNSTEEKNTLNTFLDKYF